MNLSYNTDERRFRIACRRTLLEAGDFDDGRVVRARVSAIEHRGQVRPQANLVEVLYKAGKKDEARARVRRPPRAGRHGRSGLPPLARLAPIAREFGFPTDWRLPAEDSARLWPAGGPSRRWDRCCGAPGRPPIGRSKTPQGREHSLAEFHGKPVMLIFFLGGAACTAKCSLNPLPKGERQFSDAGLTVIAVSSDNESGIKKSLADTARPVSLPDVGRPRTEGLPVVRCVR